MYSFTCTFLMVLTYPLLTHERLFDAKWSTSQFRVGPTEPVIVTKYLETPCEAKKAALVKHTAFKPVKSYAGYFTVDEEQDSNLFFWYFPAPINYELEPVVLWLQGGLGTSIMFAVFEEHGPFIVDENGTLSLREQSWHTYQNMLYIDSPIGTGFSYTSGDYLSSMEEVVTHLHDALCQFFKMFPELQYNNFFIAGESLAGRFAPELAKAIHERNQIVPETQRIHLKGLLLGNAWFDPEHMCAWSSYLQSIGILDGADELEMAGMEKETVELIREDKFEEALNSVQDILLGDKSFLYNATELLNIHNYLLDRFDNAPPNFLDFIQNTDGILQALHVAPVIYSVDSEVVYNTLSKEIVKSSASIVEELLENNYRILFYSGQLDILVAYPLTVNAIEHLKFDDAYGYIDNERCSWYVNYKIAGFVKAAGSLTEVLIRNAGHRAVIDQPDYVYDLMYRFVRNFTICG